MEDTKPIQPAQLSKTLVLEYMKRAVAEVGPEHSIDSVGCFYFDKETGKPICLIGYVLHYHGYKLKDLKPKQHAELPRTGTNGAICGLLEFFATPTAKQMMSLAQTRQDGGEGWGRVVSYVEAYFGSHSE